MLTTAEAVSLGHPDKTADYISSTILDKLMAQDPTVRYAVEVMVKGNTVILGGEVTGGVDLSNLDGYVRSALRDIGYDEKYAARWGEDAIDIRRVRVLNFIGTQSPEIGQGIRQNGWGDQGIFAGFACRGEGLINRELFLAQQLNKALYTRARHDDNLGLDIKTQITLTDDGHIAMCVAAVPMLQPENINSFICQTLGTIPDTIIVNGTGSYHTHSSVADCGMTGRKLACDFYGMACPIGGGSPWTKDPTKADLTLNLYARHLAVQYLDDNDACYVFLSSCIGRAALPSAVIRTVRNNIQHEEKLSLNKTPTEIIAELGLNRPIFARLCREGLMTHTPPATQAID